MGLNLETGGWKGSYLPQNHSSVYKMPLRLYYVLLICKFTATFQTIFSILSELFPDSSFTNVKIQFE